MRSSFARPTLPYITLDQGVLRDEARVIELLDRAKAFGELLLVPDFALYEMMQNDQWEKTLRSSLGPLSRFPAGVMLAQAPGPLLRMELSTGEPQLDIIDHEGTPWLRRLLAEIPIGGSRLIDEFASRIPAAQESHRLWAADHVKNKQRVIGMMEAWKRLLGPDLTPLVRLQKDLTRDTFRLLLANPQFHERVIRDSLLREGYSESVATGPSVAAWLFFCFAGLALKWLAGGWGSRTGEHASHDLADLNYVFTGLCCRGLESNDKMLTELYEDLAAALDNREQARAEARESVTRRTELKRRAGEVARTLADKYGATRVVLFGSVARDEQRMPGDVDLYVEGIRPEKWLDACVAAEAIMGDVPLDLVPAERARPFVRETVDAEGEMLYEAAHA